MCPLQGKDGRLWALVIVSRPVSMAYRKKEEYNETASSLCSVQRAEVARAQAADSNLGAKEYRPFSTSSPMKCDPHPQSFIVQVDHQASRYVLRTRYAQKPFEGSEGRVGPM